MKKLPYKYECLAIELAGRLQNLDDTYPPYEYINETRELCELLVSKKISIEKEAIAIAVANIFSSRLEADFNSELFSELGDYATNWHLAYRQFLE